MRSTTQEKLARLLQNTAGVPVRAQNLFPAQGYYRSSRSMLNDGPRWDGHGSASPSGAIVSTGNLYYPRFYSYDTMTNCVRFGIRLDEDNDGGIEVSAKKP